MQITEFFTSQLKNALAEASQGELTDFLPEFHTSLPDLQEDLLYLCATGRRSLKHPDYFSFQNVDGFLFLYTESGQGNVNTDGETLTLSSGSLLLWDCRDYLQLKALRSPWTVNMLFFSGKAAQIYYEEICKIRFPVFPLPADSSILGSIRQLMALGPQTSPHHAFLANKHLTDMLSDILLTMHMEMVDEKPVPPYLREIRRLFDARYQESYSLEELASRYHISRYRLCREFSSHYGITPLKYLNDVRLTHARELLETTNLKIHAIGSAVGIDNATHFINLFKAKMGITPMAYRDGYLSFREIDQNKADKPSSAPLFPQV